MTHRLLIILLSLLAPLASAATNALDRIDFGDLVSEGVHQFMPATAPADIAPRGVGAVWAAVARAGGERGQFADGVAGAHVHDGVRSGAAELS